jgi:hypothetical protein
VDASLELEEFVSTINEATESLSFEIKKLRGDENEILWGIVNTTKDKVVESATPFTPLQLKLVKFLVSDYCLNVTLTRADRILAGTRHHGGRSEESDDGGPHLCREKAFSP